VAELTAVPLCLPDSCFVHAACEAAVPPAPLVPVQEEFGAIRSQIRHVSVAYGRVLDVRRLWTTSNSEYTANERGF
jgi:hypothetical protein